MADMSGAQVRGVSKAEPAKSVLWNSLRSALAHPADLCSSGCADNRR
jgi:hypothetical protein